MDINYKQKYLKYKYKYLQLQQQGGEQNTVNSLLVTHNGRIRCLLDSINMGAIDKNTGKEIRFMNCCILLLSITKNGYKLSLEYEGNLAEDSVKKAKNEGRKYYSQTNNDDIFVKFEDQESSNTSLFKDIGDKTYNFYIIRHADGLHNSMDWKKKIYSSDVTDAVLSEEGIKQANEAKQFLKTPKIDYLYVSDLKRTRQTLAILIEGKDEIKATEVVVLPCAHELDYIKGGLCDGNQGAKGAFSYENKPKCSTDKSKCDEACCTVNNLPINWSFYSAFYGNGTRISHGQNAKRCRDTNMIQQAFEHMKSR
jgi:broad specificity phosphatase PhoE